MARNESSFGGGDLASAAGSLSDSIISFLVAPGEPSEVVPQDSIIELARDDAAADQSLNQSSEAGDHFDFSALTADATQQDVWDLATTDSEQGLASLALTSSAHASIPPADIGPGVDQADFTAPKSGDASPVSGVFFLYVASSIDDGPPVSTPSLAPAYGPSVLSIAQGSGALAAASGTSVGDDADDSMPLPVRLGSSASSSGATQASAVAASGDSFANAFDTEVSFISGITTAGKVGATSYWTWNGDNPASYAGTSNVHKWGNTTIGTAGGTVTYWFDAASNWTATEQAALTSGLALWSDEVNIQFVLAADAASANFYFKRGSDGNAFEHNSVVPSTIDGSTSNNPTGTYISIDTSVAGFGPIGSTFDLYGGYTYQTLVHEEGHLIGLGHGGPYNGNVNASTQQFSAYDSRLWSIMSYIDIFTTTAKYYNSYPVTGTHWGNNAQGYYYEPTTPMILDVLAAQEIYGAPTSTALSGGQTFGFNSNVSGGAHNYFDFTINTHPVITIYDQGTNNTLDLSGFSAGATISLTPGTFTSANGEVNNIGIAFGTVIDHAVGGSGNDVFLPNPVAATVMTGGGGNNTFQSTVGGLNADTITDGHIGDKLVFTDANPGTFTYTWNSTALTYAGTDVLHLSNNPIGHFVESVDPTSGVDLKLESATADASFKDFSADGISDILWRNNSGDVGTWELRNGSKFTGTDLGVVPTNWSIVGTGDYTHDHTSDFLWRDGNSGSVVTSELLNGNYSSNTNLGSVALNWQIMGSGDFNHDGTSDILWRDTSSGSVVTSELTNGAYAGNTTLGSMTSNWHIVGIGDFNGDGTSDVLWRDGNTGSLTTWEVTNGQISGNTSLGVVPLNWHVVGVGDFNHDGTSDILWRDGSTGDVGTWELTNGAKTGGTDLGVVPLNWQVADVGDYSDNGTSDILWRDASTGSVGTWELTNGAKTGGTDLGVIPLDWHILNGNHFDVV